MSVYVPGTGSGARDQTQNRPGGGGVFVPIVVPPQFHNIFTAKDVPSRDRSEAEQPTRSEG